MRILVTGSCGFIGSHFVRQALHRPEVEQIISLDCLTYAGNIDNLPGLFEEPNHILIKSNIRSPGEMISIIRKHKITQVVHCAAESHVDRSIEGPEAFIETNVRGTFNLLEACRKHPVQKFLHVSTDEVYGSIEEGSFTEDAPLNPSSPYSASKAAADLLCLAHHKTYGVPVVITRCVNNYGPNQYPEKLIPMVIKKALTGETIPVYGDGSNIRDWIQVEDHCEAMWLALTGGRAGEIYNVAGHNPHSNLDLVRNLCLLCEADLDRITFVKDRPGHDFRYAVSDRKISTELQFQNRKYFPTSLRQTVEWYRSYFGCTTAAPPLSQ
jgi:dTDP-glucose 4,6-dehydratase